MKGKVKLEFDQLSYDSLKNYVEETANIIIDAKNELQRLGVNHNTNELLHGDFVEKFHTHHRKAQKNENADFAKRIPYENYIDSLGLNPLKLLELQNTFKIRISKSYEFYKYNHNFYNYCEVRAPRNTYLKEFYDNAPRKVCLQMGDLFKITRNKVEVIIDPELFTLYNTNEMQTDVMDDVIELVNICKRLGRKRE